MVNKVLVAVISIVLVVVGIVALVSVGRNSALIIPGLQAKIYEVGQEVELKVNKLTSIHAQIPYGYQSFAFAFCEGAISTTEDNELLGEILVGDRIHSAPGYKINFLNEVKCQTVCQSPIEMKPEEWQLVRERVRQEYKVHWLLDELPAAYKYMTKDGNDRIEAGFPLGQIEAPVEEGEPESPKVSLLFNHANIKIHYYQSPKNENEYKIIYFEVSPDTIDYAHEDGNWKETCLSDERSYLDLESGDDVTRTLRWTYSVEWQKTEIPWSQRFDAYLKMNAAEGHIHWFSIVNSVMIVLFLAGMIAMILLRTLNADFRRYNSQDPDEETETGWKLVHGDIFRPPQRPLVFSMLIGSGVQMLMMVMITLIFAVLGFMSPANRGVLLTAVVALFVLMGVFSGYTSTRFYKLFKGSNWVKNSIATGLIFPGVVFAIFFVLNSVLWYKESSGAVPFPSLLLLLALWLCISLPLNLFGGYFAFKKASIENPVRTNQIPRPIPQAPWYMHPVFTTLLGGVLPFGAVFIELVFILASIWLQEVYYLFSFLFLVFIILIITCAEITIVMCYFQLCSEDYNWWWRSFLTAGSSAFYVFLYSGYYFFTKLTISGAAAFVLYFGYTLMMSMCLFVLTGTIGFYACFYFTRRIYAELKLE